MNTATPTRNELAAAATIANGHLAGLRKHALDGDWWLIDDETGDRRKAPPPDDAPVPAVRAWLVEMEAGAALLSLARDEGWSASAESGAIRIDLGLSRRGRAGICVSEEPGRPTSLCLEILPDTLRPNGDVVAFALHLTAFHPGVRASLLELGSGPTLCWEAPLDASAVSGPTLTRALQRLAGVVRSGQAEARLLAEDEAAAAEWRKMTLPPH